MIIKYWIQRFFLICHSKNNWEGAFDWRNLINCSVLPNLFLYCVLLNIIYVSFRAVWIIRNNLEYGTKRIEFPFKIFKVLILAIDSHYFKWNFAENFINTQNFSMTLISNIKYEMRRTPNSIWEFEFSSTFEQWRKGWRKCR